jgi:hypothetical protein
VALRLLFMTGKWQVARQYSWVWERVWCRKVHCEQRRAPCSAHDVTVVWLPII